MATTKRTKQTVKEAVLEKLDQMETDQLKTMGRLADFVAKTKREYTDSLEELGSLLSMKLDGLEETIDKLHVHLSNLINQWIGTTVANMPHTQIINEPLKKFEDEYPDLSNTDGVFRTTAELEEHCNKADAAQETDDAWPPPGHQTMRV